MLETDTKNLFDEFPAISTTEWENAILKELKGAGYEKKMIWKTSEGFDVKPFYRNEDLEGNPYVNQQSNRQSALRGYKTYSNNWEISQEIPVENPVDANKLALEALSGGADSVTFVFRKDKISGKSTFLKLTDFLKLIENINLETTTIRFESGKKTTALISLLKEIVKQKKLDSQKLKIIFNYDPIGYLTIKGNYYLNNENIFAYSATMLNEVIEQFPNIKLLGINGKYFNNAGATITHELAYSLAIASEYLSLLSENGIDIKTVANQITFNFGVGSNYFMEIAKLRSARVLWEKLLEAFLPQNSEIIPMNIHCITTDWNKSRYDHYSNLLRQTTEAMSAIIGGTQSLTVRPFDAVFGKTGEFSQRLARNLQIILKEEAHLDKVADAAGGSYYIENLTKKIIAQSWKLFLEIEEKGGYIKAFKDGFIQEKANC